MYNQTHIQAQITTEHMELLYCSPQMVRFFKRLSCDIFHLCADWLPSRKNVISSLASYLRHLSCFPFGVQLVPSIGWKVMMVRLSTVKKNLDGWIPRGLHKEYHLEDIPGSGLIPKPGQWPGADCAQGN